MGKRKWLTRSCAMLLSVVLAASIGLVPPLQTANAASLLYDDFEDGDAAGWTVVQGGVFSVVNDGSSEVYKLSYVNGSSTNQYVVNGSSTWTDYVLEAKLNNGSNDNTTGLYARYHDKNNLYALKISTKHDTITLSKSVSGTYTSLDSASVTLDTNTTYKLKLSVDGDQLTGYLDDVQLVSAVDSSFSSGKIGIGGYSKGNYSFDDVSVSDPAPTVQTYTAKKTLSPLEIDGELNESVWSISESVSKVVTGSVDNTVTYGALWDDQYLYVGIKVLDANLVNDSGSDSFDDDSVELFLDANHSKGATYDVFDWQFRKRYNDSGLFELHGETVGVKHAWAAITGGYAVELAIPWINFGITPTGSQVIGFDIAVNDDDDGATRDGQLVWAGEANNYQNTSAFGDLALSAATLGTTPTPPTPPSPVDRYVTPSGAGSKDGSSWSNAFEGDKSGGLQTAWDATGVTNTLHVGSGTYSVPQTLTLKGGGTDLQHMKKLVGADTGSGLPVFEGDFTLANQGSRKFINVPLGVSYWWIQDINIQKYFYGIYANGQHEGIRILNVDMSDMSDGVYLWGKATRANPDAGSHDIVIKDSDSVNYTKSAVRFRNGNYNASVINSTGDAGGQANWTNGNFPMGFRIGNSPESQYIFDHDIVFQDVTSSNSWHEAGSNYWNGDGFAAERQTYNLTYIRSKAFDSTDGGFDDKSLNPVYINTVAFGNKRNYRVWSQGKAMFINAVGGYSYKRGGSSGAPGLWVGGTGGKAELYYSTLYNDTNREIELDNSTNQVDVYHSIIGTTTGTSLYTTNGGQFTSTNSDMYIAGVQGADPQFVNGTNSSWDGNGNDFNSLLYGDTLGYVNPGPNDTPYTVQISVSSLSLGAYGSQTISAQVLDASNNPVGDPENVVWYSDDAYSARLLESRGENAVVQGLTAGTLTDIVANYKGEEARITVTVS
ncbi:sugar-binding protein [Paenibacillus sp. HB172176]|uniref:sugar-binding protein n=1 Tax=Paenibacillus sp. HB172176 TaxID=2493690 RepID=UPI001438C388|nr:sugar-binding protein [Paenibacillus sp. HB172176]